VRACGPTVSWLCAIGTTPARDVRPTVGFTPTTPLACAGQTMEPSVSVPSATAQRFAETATAEPELEPQGLRVITYGFRVCPPRPLHPLVERVDRMFAHSLRFVLPRRTAPAARSFSTTPASRAGRDPVSAREPAVVSMRSAVSMLSLMRIGMPCSGPRVRPARRSASSAAAISSASGFSSSTERNAGPFRSSASIRSR